MMAHTTAASGGTMSLTVSDLNRVTLAVSVTDGSGAEVFSETFTGGGTREFTVSEQIAVRLVKGLGPLLHVGGAPQVQDDGVGADLGDGGRGGLAGRWDRSGGNAQVMELIRSSTNRPGGGWDAQTGYGTIDMGRTLEAARALGGGAPEANPEPAVPETAQPSASSKAWAPCST